MFKVPANKVEIEPLKLDKIISQEKDSLIEAGKVLQVGEGVTYVKEGDQIYFEGWGCTQTPPDPEGKTHWVLWMNEKVILGKYEQ